MLKFVANHAFALSGIAVLLAVFSPLHPALLVVAVIIGVGAGLAASAVEPSPRA